MVAASSLKEGKFIYSDGHVIAEFSNLQKPSYFSYENHDSFLKFQIYGASWYDNKIGKQPGGVWALFGTF